MLDYVRPAGVRLAINWSSSSSASPCWCSARSSSSRSTREVAGGDLTDDDHTHVRRRDRRRGRRRSPRRDRASGRVKTAVISKLYPTRSHTGAAQGGVCAALGNIEEDYPEWHAFDTVKGGDYLVDQPAAQLLTEEAVDAIYQLERWGLPFNRTPDGLIDQRRFGGHTANHGERPVKRACYAADRTGHMILQTLYQQCVKRDVRFFNEFYCLDLLRADDGRTAGVVAYELATGELHVFRAKSVLFATGGYGRMFRVSSNAHALTGDGPRSRTGAASRSRTWSSSSSIRPASTGWASCCPRRARGEGAIVLNKRRRAVHGALRPDDQGPRPARRGLAVDLPGDQGGPRRSARRATASTSTSRHLDPKVIEEKLPDITEFARVYLRVEPTREPVPIQPTAHYAMGGIPTDVDGACRRRGRTRRPSPACTPRANARASASTGPTGWGRTRCSTSSCSDAGAATTWRAFARETDLAGAPRRATAHTLEMLDGILTRRRSDNVGRHPLGAAGLDVRPRVRGPDRGEPREDGGDPRGLRDRYEQVAIRDKGSVYNTDLMEAVELGFLLDCADDARRGRPGPRREPRRALPRGPSAPRRRELAQALARVPSRTTARSAWRQAGEDGSLRPDGAEVLMATAADVLEQLGPASRRPADGPDVADPQDPPVQPGGLRGSVVGRVHGAGGSRSTGWSRRSTR